jgi:hypothetical protein
VSRVSRVSNNSQNIEAECTPCQQISTCQSKTSSVSDPGAFVVFQKVTLPDWINHIFITGELGDDGQSYLHMYGGAVGPQYSFLACMLSTDSCIYY